jgi:hypothetical protein
MFKNKLAIYISLAVMLGVFMQSCNSVTKDKPLPLYPDFTDQHPDLVDTSWLTNESCVMPCWRGLQLGKSSMTDAVETVTELLFVDSNSMWSVDVKLPQKIVQVIGFKCKSQLKMDCLAMQFNGNVLDSLSISPNYQITFEQAVEKLGDPDGYVYSPLGAEIGGCDISLIWTKRQMTLDFTEKTHIIGEDLCGRLLNANWKVPKGILVQTVSYRFPAEIEKLKSYDTYMIWTGFEK